MRKWLHDKLRWHKYYYVWQGLMTSIIECDICGFRSGVGNDLYSTKFPVEQPPKERKLFK